MRRVLVVDDDRDIRELLRVMLELSGYDVVTVNDGEAALAYLTQADEACLVLLDIMMPRMSGLEVCARLAAMGEAAARHRVVLMTAGSFPEGDAPPPARALLHKPFDLKELEDLIADLAASDADVSDSPISRVSSIMDSTHIELQCRVA